MNRRPAPWEDSEPQPFEFTGKPPKVLLVDDDKLACNSKGRMLEDMGLEVVTAYTADQAITDLGQESFDVYVLDLMMPSGSKLSRKETQNGNETGVALARLILKKDKGAKIVAHTGAYHPHFTAVTEHDQYFRAWVPKSGNADLARTIKRLAFNEGPSSFLVHGRDRRLALSVQGYVHRHLGLPEPIILSQQRSGGKTIIEKFEAKAREADIVFVLLTPDDVGFLAGQKSAKQRARQNVIFEMGYFLGFMSRRSGRVILLCKGDIELPSDMHGVVYIDISRGIAHAAEEIREELDKWL